MAQIKVMVPKTVFIQGSYPFPLVRMFNERGGYRGVKDIRNAQIVLWTGGEDVNPKLYGEEPIPETGFNDNRDREDIKAWDKAIVFDSLRIGICRGAQLLNCLNGGSLWQHVNNHTRSHDLMDCKTGECLSVTSTHHQMMRPSPKGEIVALASESTTKKAYKQTVELGKPTMEDVEVVWYKESKSLCFQPHPEYQGNGACTDYFFELLERYGS